MNVGGMSKTYQVLGYRGNRYKSFGSQLEAEQYLAAAANSSKQKAAVAMKSDVPKKMTTVKNGMSIESPPPPAGLVKVKRNSRQHFPSKSSPGTSSSSTAVVGGSSATVNSSKQTVLTLLDVPKIKIKPPPRKSPKSPVLVKMKHNHSPTKTSLEKIQWSSSSTTESPNFSSITVFSSSPTPVKL
jgi:viroplasmin and RNaseH domain-containing protein